MTRYKIPHGQNGQQGVWFYVNRDGKRCVKVSCPECGTIGSLDHDVNEDGDVSPSLQCPRDGCTFHKFVTLDEFDIAEYNT
jgi:hypothetical protein